jgi:F-box associated protein
MIRSADNFLYSPNDGTTLNSNLTSGEGSQANSNNIKSLPDELILSIFTTLSAATLRQISLVCKLFEINAKKDILWQNIAEAILFPHEIESKPKDRSYKDYCKDWLRITNIGFPLLKPPRHTLAPRDPDFLNRVKLMKLPNYKLLSPSETRALIKENETSQLIEAVCKDCPYVFLSLHHAAQQQTGKITFNFLNCTPYVISFNSEQKMLINNKLTARKFTPNDFQFIILISAKFLHIYTSRKGFSYFTMLTCDVNDLNLADPPELPIRRYLPIT